MPRLRLTRRAREQLAALPIELRIAVDNAVARMFLDPTGAGRPLRGRFEGVWVIRVGSYRILYTIEGPESSATVVVRAIRHRSVAYRRPGA